MKMASSGSSYVQRKIAQLQHPSLSQALTAFTTTNSSQIKQIHAHIITTGLYKHPQISTRFLASLAINGHNVDYADLLFHQIQNPTRFIFNTMIRAHSQSQTTQPFQSIHFYIQMLRSGIHPDRFTFPFLFKSASTVTPSLPLGQQLHTHVLKVGFYSSDVFVVNNAINMYSTCGEMADARLVFDENLGLVDVVSWTTLVTGHSNSGKVDEARRFFDLMPCKNTVSWNAMITGYVQSGRIDEARRLFEEMPERNVASWSSLISGYSQSGLCREALALLEEMIESGNKPNEPALVSSISACVQLRSLEEGIWLHGYILQFKYEINMTLGTALVDMYGKCGDIEKAMEVFVEMPEKNVMSWNSMLTGLALNGYGKQALSLFWKMQKVGPIPNSITFIGVLSGCSHSGLVNEGQRLFEMMKSVYKIDPQLEHYGCMVDLLGRAGLIEEALEFVKRMPVEPHPGLWGALVGACRTHGVVEVGEEVGKHLIEMEPQHSGRYVLLSNLLAAAERWNDAEMVRNLLKERNLLKTAGNSKFVET